MKDGGTPMFKFKTTKTIQGVLIPFWWPGSGLVISSSWRDPRVTVESSWKRLLLFFLTRLTAPLGLRGWDQSEQRTRKELAKHCPKRIYCFLWYIMIWVILHPWSRSGIYQRKCNQSQTSRIQTPVRKNLVSTLQECSHYRHRDFKMFGVFGTKGTVCLLS